jgi:acetolactate synthase-1/3 small subunit
MRQTLSVLVENKSGVLARIAGLFSARGFNIESLTVAKTMDPSFSRITMVVEVEKETREQVLKQLNKQINVVQVIDLTEAPAVERELALIKIHVPHDLRSRLLQEVEVFRAKVVDSAPGSITVEVTGEGDKLEAMLLVLEQYGRVDMVRTGTVALPRGAASARNGNGNSGHGRAVAQGVGK